MKNKLTDLHNHLFMQLERLGDEDIGGEKLAEEIDRAKAMTGVSSQILNIASLSIKAAELMHESGKEVDLPKMLMLTE
jgi:hypothetical protein